MDKQKILSNKAIRFFGSSVGKAVLSIALVLIIGCIFNADGAFFKVVTHRDALRQMSVYGILAVAMTLVIISGGIDLAQGSTLALSSVLFCILTIHLRVNPILAILVCILAGGLLGGVSGVLISRYKLQPFIATLAMQSFIRGLARLATSNKKVSTYITMPDGTTQSTELPSVFGLIDRRILGGNLTVVTVIFVVILAATWFILSRHKWGREIYAIGGSEEAARLSGIPVRWAKTKIYIYSGILCAIAGICQAAQETQGDPGTGVGYETLAISMAVIGGTSMVGGRGGMGLTVFGVLTIGYLQKVLSINAVPEAWRLMITGAIIIIAVLAQGINKK